MLRKVRNQRCLVCHGTGQVTPLFTALNVKSICNNCNGYGYQVILRNKGNKEKAIKVDQLSKAETFF